MGNNTFVFNLEWYAVLLEYPAEVRFEVYEAIMRYAASGTLPDLKPLAKMAFSFIKKEMDRQKNKPLPGYGRSGESHWNWKGGVSDTNHRIRASGTYNEWRKAIFERDGYTCQKCGQKGGKLNAHHIIPFSVAAELRFETSNGLTLCRDCHIKLHKTERLWEKKAL